MARPRVFISSTYYDLHYIREDLEKFVEALGYEPVLFEKGHIPYGSKESPQEYVYKEIDSCDLLVCLIGGRYGTESTDMRYSVTQKELKYAQSLGKQVYIFIEHNVLGEYETYKLNKNLEMKYRHVDDKKVYEFLDEIKSLPRNNPIFPFNHVQDITEIFKQQIAGMFQRLLQEEALRTDSERTTLNTTISSLEQIIHALLTKDSPEIASSFPLDRHPLISRIRYLLNVKYRLIFSNLDELDFFLEARGYKVVEKKAWDDDDVREWIGKMTSENFQWILKIPTSYFDSNEDLLPANEIQWDESKVILTKYVEPTD